MPSWDESVEKARKGLVRSIEGRFTVALASFEQFDPYGKGIPWEPGQGRHTPTGLIRRNMATMLDFAEDVGIAYPTLANHRSVVMWWCEGEPSDIDRYGIPNNVAWDGLRFARGHWPFSQEFRDLIGERDPMNGKVWSRDELERLAGQAPPPKGKRSPARVETFDATVVEVSRSAERLARSLGKVRKQQLDADQRAALLDHAQRAKAAADFLVAFLEGDDGDPRSAASNITAPTGA